MEQENNACVTPAISRSESRRSGEANGESRAPREDSITGTLGLRRPTRHRSRSPLRTQSADPVASQSSSISVGDESSQRIGRPSTPLNLHERIRVLEEERNRIKLLEFELNRMCTRFPVYEIRSTRGNRGNVNTNNPQLNVNTNVPLMNFDTNNSQMNTNTNNPQMNVNPNNPQMNVNPNFPHININRNIPQINVNPNNPQINVNPNNPQININSNNPHLNVNTEGQHFQQDEIAADRIIRGGYSPGFSTQDLLIHSLKDLIHKNIVPVFDPSEKHQRVDIWIKKVNECAVFYSWDERMTTHFALQKLQGFAKTWYNSLDSVFFSWEEWQLKLLGAFPCDRNFSKCLNDMLQRRSEPNEPIERYYHSKVALLNQCRIYGKDAVDCIIQGISDQATKTSAMASRCAHPDVLLQFLVSNKESIPENFS